MPRINRIRLVNFAWGTQKIDNLILDFHGGQNTELRLDNGGGKSVLERLIYNAVWPGKTVSRNPISDYLKNKPSVTSIEWIMDNDSRNLFTCGAVMVKNNRTDEDANTQKYFCFTSGNPRILSIDKLPNIREEGRNLIIDDYSQARTRFAAIAANHPEVHVFSDRERAKYHDELALYGISAETWDTLILQMISGENPFAEILSSTTTSDTLLNRYLIPHIEKHLDAGQEHPSDLAGLLTRVAKDYSAEDRHIALRDNLRSYLDERHQADESLQTVQQAVEKREESLVSLNSMTDALEQAKKADETQLDDIQAQLKENEQLLIHIRQEEASFEYYNVASDFQAAEEDYQDSETSFKKAGNAADEAEHILRAWNGAYWHGKVLEHENRIQTFEDRLSAQSENEDQKKLSAYKYTLKTLYAGMMKKHSSSAASLKDTIQKEEEEKKNISEEIKVIEGEIYDTNARSGHNDAEIMNYESLEAALFKRLSLPKLQRNIIAEPDHKDVKAKRRILEKRIQDSALSLRKNEESLHQSIHQYKENQDRLTKIPVEIAGQRTECEKTRKELDHYVEQKEQLSSFLKEYGLRLSLFDSFSIEQKISEYQSGADSKLIRLKQRQEMRRSLLHSIENGSIYIPSEAAAYLEQNGISYESGEAFLLEREPAEIPDLLRQNPLLPYGILLENAEMRRLRQKKDMGILIRQLIPVYSYDDLNSESSIDSTDGILEINRQKYIANLHDELFNKESRQAYAEKVNFDLKADEREILETAGEIEHLRLFQTCAEDFHYSEDIEETLKNAINALLQKISDLHEIQNELSEQQNSLEKQADALRSAITSDRKEKETAESNLLDFDHFIQNDQTYLDLLHKKDAYAASLHQLSQKKKDNTYTLEKLNHDCSENILTLEREQNNAKNDQNEYARFADAEEAEIIPGSLDEIRTRYDALFSTMTASFRMIQDSIARERASLNEAKEKLSRLSIPEEEYAGMQYDVRQEDAARKKAEDTAAAREESRKIMNQASMQYTRLKERLEIAGKNIAKEGLKEPIGREDILGNFDERKKNAENEAAKLQQNSSQLIHHQNTLDRALVRIKDKNLSPSDHIDTSFILQEDVSKQAGDLIQDYNHSCREVIAAKDTYLKGFQAVKKKYIHADQIFEKIYEAENPLESTEEITEEILSSYQAAQAMQENRLNQIIDQLDANLKHLDDDRNQLLNITFNRAKQIYQALTEVSHRSNMYIEGKKSRVNLLRINMAETNDEDGLSRMEAHLNTAIHQLADFMKSGDVKESVIAGYIDARKILDIYLGNPVIQVKVYKFEQYAPSHLVSWEEACRSNSGGEHSISCFIVIASLISYIRNENEELEDGSYIHHYEAIMCDNPFAAVSSEHLVRPLITIVKNLHIQLICFTHNNASSIANQFDVVIQLRNAVTKPGSQNLLIDRESVSEEARTALENADFYVQAKQESLF